jgi:hypothetical protein
MMSRIVVLVVCLSSLLPCYLFAQADRKDEVSQLMVGLESASQVQRVKSAKVISRSGLQDLGLYVKVADLLSAGYMQKYEKEHADEMSWMCKALAASGDQQYRELLDEVATKAPSIKVKKYAKESLKMIDTYAKKNKIMNSTEGDDQNLSAKQNRLINMLRSDDIGLRRDAAKDIVRNYESDEKVFSAAANALSDMSKDFHSEDRPADAVDIYNQHSFDTPKGPHLSSLQVDTMAWICKALAVSDDKKYIDLLEHVHDNSPSQKLRSYASKALKALK